VARGQNSLVPSYWNRIRFDYGFGCMQVNRSGPGWKKEAIVSSFSKLMLALGILLATGSLGWTAPTKEVIAKKVQVTGRRRLYGP